jgi:hypothetical protein
MAQPAQQPQAWPSPPAAPQGLSPAPPGTAGQPAQGHPMAGHVKAVAIIDLVFAGITALVSLFLIFGLGVGMAAVDSTERYGTPGWVAGMLGALALIFGIVGAGVALVYALAGLRLLAWRRSGKGLGIAAAVIQVVVGLPTIFGAGVGLLILGAGIYGLVILLSAKTDALLVNP